MRLLALLAIRALSQVRFQKQIELTEAERLAKTHHYLVLLVGDPREAIFIRYSDAFANLAASYTVTHSCAFYASFPAKKVSPALVSRGVEHLPALLHYYWGHLARIDTKFDKELAPEDDTRLKALMAVAARPTSEVEFSSRLAEHECVFVIPAFPNYDQYSSSALIRIKELYFSLPWGEFDLALYGASDALELQCHGLPQNQLPLSAVSAMSLSDLRQWVFRQSHRKVFHPGSALSRVFDQNYWAVVLFTDGKLTPADSAVLAQELHAAANDDDGESIFCFCDAEVEDVCRELIALFELDHLVMPFARVIYSAKSADASTNRSFRLSDDRLASLLYQGQTELTREGLSALAKDMKSLDVELEIRMQDVPLVVTDFFTGTKNYVLPGHLVLNSRFVKFFSQEFTERDRILFIYDSRKGESPSLLESFIVSLEPRAKQAILFGSYDIGLNHRGPWAPKAGQTPCIRVYRKEDSLRGYYAERLSVYSFSRLVNAFVDLLFEDHFIQ